MLTASYEGRNRPTCRYSSQPNSCSSSILRPRKQRGRAVRYMVDERSSELVQHRRERGCNGAVLANDQCGKGACGRHDAASATNEPRLGRLLTSWCAPTGLWPGCPPLLRAKAIL